MSEKQSGTNAIAICMVMGISFGVTFGAVYGNIAIGISMGLVVGIIVGAAVKNFSKAGVDKDDA